MDESHAETAPESEAQGTLREASELVALLGRGRDEWLEITQTRPLAYSTTELETAQRVAIDLRRLAEELDRARLTGRDAISEIIGNHDGRTAEREQGVTGEAREAATKVRL